MCHTRRPTEKMQTLLQSHAVLVLSALLTLVGAEPNDAHGNHSMIVCPLDNASRYFDIKLMNDSLSYCSDVTVRQCRDQSGCVGQKYSPNETLYESCGIYTNPNTSSWPEQKPSLPLIIRVDADPKGMYKGYDSYDHSAAYLEFVCDPQPGVAVDKITEFWPGLVPVKLDNKTYEMIRWPKKLSTDRYNYGMPDPSSPPCYGSNSYFCPSGDAPGDFNEFCCINCAPGVFNTFVWNMTIDASECKSGTKVQVVVQNACACAL